MYLFFYLNAFIYLFIYVVMYLIRVGVVVLLHLQVFICQMHYMLVTILVAVPGKKTEIDTRKQHNIISAAICRQLRRLAIICALRVYEQATFDDGFSPLLWHRAIILFVGRGAERDFVAHAEFPFCTAWNWASVSRFTMPFFSCLTECQDSDYLLLTRPNLLP